MSGTWIATFVDVCAHSNFQTTALTDPQDEDDENGEVDSTAGRFVRYQFTPAFLRLRTVGAT